MAQMDHALIQSNLARDALLQQQQQQQQHQQQQQQHTYLGGRGASMMPTMAFANAGNNATQPARPVSATGLHVDGGEGIVLAHNDMLLRNIGGQMDTLNNVHSSIEYHRAMQQQLQHQQQHLQQQQQQQQQQMQQYPMNPIPAASTISTSVQQSLGGSVNVGAVASGGGVQAAIPLQSSSN